MKFLCVPCDTPMQLQNVAPPERGSLSVVYACPACGYEMAMLTNAYETQIVQSLGVRIGPAENGANAAASSKTGGCPFVSMIPATATDGAPAQQPQGDTSAVRWTAAAEARLANIPSFVRPMAKTGIEQFARERGSAEIDEQMLDAAREFFGM